MVLKANPAVTVGNKDLVKAILDMGQEMDHPARILYFTRTENAEHENAALNESDLADDAAAAARETELNERELTEALRGTDLWPTWDDYLCTRMYLEDLNSEAMYRLGLRDGIRLAISLMNEVKADDKKDS